MFALGFLFLVASAVAHPATLDARPPIIDYEIPLGYYPHAPLLRSSMPVLIEEHKGEKHDEKGAVADIADVPILPPLNVPFIHEVVIENEPKKEIAEKSDKPAAEKPEKLGEEKPTIVKVEEAHPHVVRFWPSWLPQISFPFNVPDLPVVSNILSFANKPTTILQPAGYRAIPVVLK